MIMFLRPLNLHLGQQNHPDIFRARDFVSSPKSIIICLLSTLLKMQQIGKTKPHAICIPYPTQGHINPFMQLAKLLHSRGFFITFVNTEFNHKSFIESKGPESIKGLSDFLFETIPDGLPSSDPNRILDVRALSDSTRKHCLGPLKELLLKLNSKAEVPPVTCIVSDGVMSFAIKAAEEFGIPEIQFWTASACSFMGYLHFSELLNRGIIPFKDENFMYDGTLDAPINWIPGMKNVRLKDIPSFIRDTNDIMFDFLGSEALNCLKSSAIIFNTFDEFEYQVLEAISVNFPKIYNIGPLTLLSGHIPENQSKSLNSSLWKEDLNCLDWLNAREPNSVLYINYGSVSTITDQHFKEFALGLAKSNKQFLWIVRPDLVTGNSGSLLPQEFIEETKDRGFLTSWCPQEQVLKHPSVGFFLTHCGWNSIMETICAGVPIICWPFFADQQTNCRYACTIWEIGVEMNHNDDVKSHEVETLIKEMEGEMGKKLRYKAIEWKKKAEKAIDIGGSSFNDFEKMIKELSLF